MAKTKYKTANLQIQTQNFFSFFKTSPAFLVTLQSLALSSFSLDYEIGLQIKNTKKHATKGACSFLFCPNKNTYKWVGRAIFTPFSKYHTFL
jgi:hypothetical protein